MVTEMKILKFETMLEDIQKALKNGLDDVKGIEGVSLRLKNFNTTSFLNSVGKHLNSNSPVKTIINNPAMCLIYDVDKVNDYGKVIMNHSNLFLCESNDKYYDVWTQKYQDINDLKDEKKKMIAAKELVRLCRLDENRSEAYKFIFWALMILTVDKSDYEEHLSIICDFASMLKITEDEIDDILLIIKLIYHLPVEDKSMKTTTVTGVFEVIFYLL